MTRKPYSLAVRVIALACCLMLAAALFAGCKKKEEGKSSSKIDLGTSSAEPKTDVIEKTVKDPQLPDTADLGGFELIIAAEDTHTIIPEEGDSAEGDLMLESLKALQTQYNCKVTLSEINDWSTEAVTPLLAGELVGHVLFPRVHQCGQFISARLCADFNNSEIAKYIHMDEAWWNSTIAYAANVQGSVYAGAPDIQSSADATEIIFFNKRIAKEIGVPAEDLYKMYYDKTWTWDKFREIAKKGVKDLNNDGKMDETDQWGFVSPTYDGAEAFATSAHCVSIVTDNGENPRYNYNTPFAITTLMALNDLFTADGFFFDRSEKKDAADNYYFNSIFQNGRALFRLYTLGSCSGEGMRAMDDEYGILPLPLGLAEDGGWQKEYASRVDHNFHLTLIPATNTELSNTAFVLEALAFNYWKLINKKTETYGALYLSDDDSAYIATQIYNYSYFEISQFLYSINNMIYAQTVLGKMSDLTHKQGYDVAGMFTGVADAAQIIIDDYFAGN